MTLHTTAREKSASSKMGTRRSFLTSRFRPPWYEIPPFDFVTENLVPVKVTDHRKITYEMRPMQIESREQIMQKQKGCADRAWVNPLRPLCRRERRKFPLMVGSPDRRSERTNSLRLAVTPCHRRLTRGNGFIQPSRDASVSQIQIPAILGV